MGADRVTDETENGISRKTLLKAALMGVPIPLLLGQAAPALAGETGRLLDPTPFCDDDPTVQQPVGVHFRPSSPARNVFPGSGTPLKVSGFVVNRSCDPLPNVLMDFWHADSQGKYDSVGFAFRGHQLTDPRGAFKLTTVVPGAYPSRTRHIHVKIQAPGLRLLTTQLYFPGEPRNSVDVLFDPRLLLNMYAGNGTYVFVLDSTG
ncbi:dioxygenase [Streptosporangium sp. NPDC020072]|uniref:dioxygenase family protein n=1 Tax=Streptosporangium sp. NPDC020072 TaxID=3154788 RepID=UPI003433AB9A